MYVKFHYIWMFGFNNQITVTTIAFETCFSQGKLKLPGGAGTLPGFYCCLFLWIFLWHNDDPPSVYFKVNGTC